MYKIVKHLANLVFSCMVISITAIATVLVTLDKKIRKSQEILGKQDSADSWILNESIESEPRTQFLHVVIP